MRAVLWVIVEGEKPNRKNRYEITNPELAMLLVKDTIFNVKGLGHLRIGSSTHYEADTLLISARELLPWEPI